MSYLETGKGRFTWLAAAQRSSAEPELGCVQCGSRLEITEAAKNFTGKCGNCADWVNDDDDASDDLEY